jgi:hypothetical protein
MRSLAAISLILFSSCSDVFNGGSYSQPSYRPPSPTGVTAAALSSNSIRLSWSSVSYATAYRIYRSRSQNGDYRAVGKMNVSSTSSSTYVFTDYDLSPGTTYYYKVAVVAYDAEGILSTSASATTSGSSGGTPPSGGFPPSSFYNLYSDSWRSNSLSAGQVQWYRFTASGGTYYVHWYDRDYSSSSYPADIKVSAYTGGGIPIFPEVDTGYSSINATSRRIYNQSGYIYLKVEGYSPASSGSYRIKYSSSTSP